MYGFVLKRYDHVLLFITKWLYFRHAHSVAVRNLIYPILSCLLTRYKAGDFMLSAKSSQLGVPKLRIVPSYQVPWAGYPLPGYPLPEYPELGTPYLGTPSYPLPEYPELGTPYLGTLSYGYPPGYPELGTPSWVLFADITLWNYFKPQWNLLILPMWNGVSICY